MDRLPPLPDRLAKQLEAALQRACDMTPIDVAAIRVACLRAIAKLLGRLFAVDPTEARAQNLSERRYDEGVGAPFSTATALQPSRCRRSCVESLCFGTRERSAAHSEARYALTVATFLPPPLLPRRCRCARRYRPFVASVLEHSLLWSRYLDEYSGCTPISGERCATRGLPACNFLQCLASCLTYPLASVHPLLLAHSRRAPRSSGTPFHPMHAPRPLADSRRSSSSKSSRCTSAR